MNVATVLVALFAQTSSEPSLTFGSPAPELKVEKWLRGSGKDLQPGKTYVLEFWATWCGPCIDAMPHLSDLSDKYKDKVEFIGVNIADRRVAGEEQPGSVAHVERVTKWVEANKDKMRYSIVLDDAGNTMNRTWMTAAGRNGIPCTFVVQDKTVLWIGHPNAIDKPLEQIVEGTYDLKAAKAAHEAELALATRAGALRTVAMKGDLEETDKAFLSFKKDDPNKGVGQIVPLAHALAEANPAAGVEFLERRSKDTYDEPSFLVMIGYAIHPKVQKDAVALKALAEFTGKWVSKVPEPSAAISYAYHSLLLLKNGDKAGALEWAKKAEAKVDVFEPLKNRENIRNFVKSALAQAEQK